MFDLRRLALEAAAERAPRPEESLENLTRLLGEDWAARGTNAAMTTPWPLGIGVTLSNETLPASDPDKKLQEFTKDAEAAIVAGELNSRERRAGRSIHWQQA